MQEEKNNLNNSKIEDKEKTLSKEQYFKLLQEWVNLQNAFRAMTYLPLLNQNQPTVPNLTASTTTTTQNQPQNRPNFQVNRWFDDGTRAEEIIETNGGYEMLISPLYKRFLAEVLDTIILFVVKIALFVILIDLLDINIALDLDLTDIKDMKFLEDDYSQLLNLSSEFIVLEILTKFFSCIYEAVFAIRFGGTLGKLVMGIKIVQGDAVIALEQQINHSQGIRALIYPASNLTFVRAFMRALAKNLLISLLFPVYFMMFFYRSNQLIYDMFCKTVVVENSPPAIYRRRNQQ
ncbi:hypothetical protein PVAND_010811 [Polypedilum vanderplanki]|uniref:RDD domain-containing protein n=1 Tax=Polypedilum vanderplanki TaxID=319348 RepID=A0A9J6CGQ4_POLVA|nr:hypothetical protein PVAND_010811 [Polypedilum vanderplanki]